MGYPLSSYEGFKALLDNQSINHSHYRQETSKFKLFGIIVHDPLVNNEFDDFINQRFESFDRITGDNFLFFALAQPSERWHQRHSQRDYHLFIKDEVSHQEKKLDTYSFCKYFDVEYTDLPVLILSNSLTFDGFISVKTNTTILPYQLEEISQFCDMQDGFFNMFQDEEFKSLINRINKETTDFYVNRATSIAEGMVDLFSITNEEQKLVAMNALSTKIFEKVNKLRQTQSGEFDNRIEQLILFIATRFATLNSSANHHALQLLDGLEPESRILLETLNAIYPTLHNTKAELEFSAGIIPLTKLFEIEVNLSFIQHIRYLLDVEMPKYFNKPDRTKRNLFFPTRAFPTESDVSINVNKSINNKFQPPELGGTERAVKVLIENKKLPQSFDKNKIQSLMKYWEDIRLIRNAVAHTGALTNKDLDKIIEIFSSMQREGILEEIIKLKESLKN